MILKKNEVGEVLNVSYIEFYEDSEYMVKIFFPIAKIFFEIFVFVIFYTIFFLRKFVNYAVFLISSISRNHALGMQQNSRSIFVNFYLVIITVVPYLYAIFPIYGVGV